MTKKLKYYTVKSVILTIQRLMANIAADVIESRVVAFIFSRTFDQLAILDLLAPAVGVGGSNLLALRRAKPVSILLIIRFTNARTVVLANRAPFVAAPDCCYIW